MLVKEVLEKSNQFLKNKGIESSRLDAELIISHILKMERISLYLKFDQPLGEEEINQCRQKIMERGRGVPVAYLLNKKYFYNYEFFVDNRVLIPRPETELLVEQVLIWVREHKKVELRFLDLGCGSGCISVVLIAELKKMGLAKLKGVAVDISEDAIDVAKINSYKILESNFDLEFIQSDAANFATDQLFDLIVANPPYIDFNDPNIQKTVKDFEPHLALFANDKGFACIKSWVKVAAKFAKSGGLLIFEIGHEQGLEAQKIFSDTGAFSSVELIKDFSGFNRFIKAVRNG